MAKSHVWGFPPIRGLYHRGITSFHKRFGDTVIIQIHIGKIGGTMIYTLSDTIEIVILTLDIF